MWLEINLLQPSPAMELNKTMHVRMLRNAYAGVWSQNTIILEIQGFICP